MSNSLTGEVSPNGDISEAARWLATTPERQRPHPIIPYLCKAFDLTAVEACKAAREANLIKVGSYGEKA